MVPEINEINQLNENMSNSESLFKTIFHEATFGIALTDSLTGKIYEVNKMFATIAGRTMEEIKSANWMSLTHSEDIQKDIDNMALLNSGKTSGFQMEKRYVLPDGNIVWINMKIVPLETVNKSSPCHLCMIEDITDRHSKESDLRKLSRAVQQSPVSIIITDLDGKIIYVNPKVSEVTGYKPDELLGKNIRIMKSGETPKENYIQLWETILSGNDWRGEFLNKKKSGELFWESASLSPIFNSKNVITNFLAIKEDITERKKVIAELESAKHKAELSDRLKTAFINNISHETRTPLNSILGFSSLLLQSDYTYEERTQFHSIIKASSDRLLNTISNYMDMALITSGNIIVNPKVFTLNQMLRSLWNQFKPLCDVKKLQLRLQIPDQSEIRTLCSDAEMISKIFSHLLDNSVKFTNQGEITFGYIIKPGSIEFYVKDTGIGISKNAQDLIFESFIQEEISHTRGHEGSGLGLSIAQGLVELLNGTITLDSEKGKGSAFIFNLPIGFQESPDIISGTTINKTHLPEKPVILIADDDHFNHIYLESIFKRDDLIVYSANNGQEAVDFCMEHPEISLVLMDLKMPVMDGFEATQKIKSFRKDLPVIAITAFAMSGDEKRILEAGCDDYIAKPIKRETLRKKLSTQGILL